MGGTTRTLTYQYDANGNRTRITHPEGAWFTYNYDMTNRRTLVRESGVNWLNGFSYTAAGLPDGQSYGGTFFTIYGYDGLGRLSVANHNLPGTAQDVQFTYTRNSASELASVTRNNDAYAWAGHYAVNRAYAVNTLNQYTAAGTTGLSYDANGNLISDGSNAYLYDVENRLVAASGAHNVGLSYDPLGRLWRMTHGYDDTRFLYDGDALVAEYDGAGNELRRYVHNVGTDVPSAVYDGTGLATLRFLIPDERGSIIALSDVAGAAMSINTYDEYGIPGGITVPVY
jgi:YD repeat-containing protein